MRNVVKPFQNHTRQRSLRKCVSLGWEFGQRLLTVVTLCSIVIGARPKSQKEMTILRKMIEPTTKRHLRTKSNARLMAEHGMRTVSIAIPSD